MPGGDETIPQPPIRVLGEERDGRLGPAATVYKSPPPLPRLDTRTSTPLYEVTASSSDPSPSSRPQSRSSHPQGVPVVYQSPNQDLAPTGRDYYPTPISVGEREQRPRWQVYGHDRPIRGSRGPPGHIGYDTSPQMSRSDLPLQDHARPRVTYEPQMAHVRGYPPSSAYPGPVYHTSAQRHGANLVSRPRLSIHPYVPPRPVDPRYYSAGATTRPHLSLNMGFERDFQNSPNSSVSPCSFKAPRKRGMSGLLCFWVHVVLLTDQRTMFNSTSCQKCSIGPVILLQKNERSWRGN